MCLMLEQLRKDPTKIPRTERDDIIEMLTGAMESIYIDVDERMKLFWVTKRLN